MATGLRPSQPVRPQGLRWFALAGCAVGLITAVMLRAPAVWLADAATRISGQHLVLAGASGTVWRGSAQVVLTGGPTSTDRRALPQRLSWSLSPRLSRERGLHLRLALQHPRVIEDPLVLSLGLMPLPGSVVLETSPAAPVAQVVLPASALGGLGAPWNTLEPRGRMELHLQRLSLGTGSESSPEPRVQARMALVGMGSRISTLPILGHYELQVQGNGELHLRLSSDPSSALLLIGQGRWKPGSRVEFRGEASAAEGREAALSNLLNIIGRREGPRSIISMQS